ncbi:MAG: PorV/PorQ family protein [candidate division KSB1 bacterium]|nr:PorV/PorQ family protein [candidate division KSB1 bacterium]MDZ7300573.1 PorV/PorQ family protein [candidate division KSB1 bacterium]MDZ7309710.1 PorV/PorQ family protein [candidate division KSB1 bacterium]
MKKLMIILFIGLLIGGLWSAGGYAQEHQKLAQTGFQFLSVVSDARAAAMAEAMTSLQIGSSALFFNPAGMADMTNFVDATASLNQWIADIRHSTYSLALRPAGGSFGVFGFSVQHVKYGEFYGTRVNKATALGYEDTGIFELSAIAFGVGYAKQLTDRFCVGGQVRWVRQDLGESVIPMISATDTSKATVTNELTPLVFDFGTQFKTGIKSLVFGMTVRNFSKEIKYVEEGFQVPLVFNLGISMNVMDLMAGPSLEQSLYVTIDASHYRDHPEQIKVGLDYRLMKMLSLRAGYVSSNDESGLSFGMGVSRYGFGFDYAYTPFGVFDKVQRLTARFSL